MPQTSLPRVGLVLQKRPPPSYYTVEDVRKAYWEGIIKKKPKRREPLLIPSDSGYVAQAGEMLDYLSVIFTYPLPSLRAK